MSDKQTDRSDAVFGRRVFILGASVTGAALVALPGHAFAASAITSFRPRGSGDFDHGAFDTILSATVKPDGSGYNRVDYRAVKARQGELKAYIAALQSARPSQMSRAAALAYWINLYNAVTLDVVADHYPVRSIKDIDLGGGGLFGSGPWSRDLMTVEGTALSLDDIEHRIVRPIFDDPLAHYGLNCASYSCPNLMTRAYTAANVGAMLRENASAYINHPRGVAVENGRIRASKIYSWYDDDFGGKDRLKAHWTAFATPDHARAIEAARIGRFRYDWSLNGV